MEIIYLPEAEVDLAFWVKTGKKNIIKRIAQITRSIIENPFTGIGKPEPLKFQLKGKWSRRIDKENRYIYKVENNELIIYSLRGHYH